MFDRLTLRAPFLSDMQGEFDIAYEKHWSDSQSASIATLTVTEREDVFAITSKAMEVTQNHDEASVYVPSHRLHTRPDLALAESGTTKRWNIFLDAASCIAKRKSTHALVKTMVESYTRNDR